MQKNEWLDGMINQSKQIDQIKKLKYKIGDIEYYYPYGKGRDSIEVSIINTFEDYQEESRPDGEYLVEPTNNGKKDCEFMGYVFDVEGEWVQEYQLND